MTLRQPYASLIVAGVMDVVNFAWPVPSTLPQWERCIECGQRWPNDPEALGDWCKGDTRCFAKTPDGPFPFRVLIHSAQEYDREAVRFYPTKGEFWLQRPKVRLDKSPGLMPLGSLIGSVSFTGCHHANDHPDDDADFPYLVDTDHGWQCSEWAERGRYHWIPADPQPLPDPIPVKGRQGLWVLPGDLAAIEGLQSILRGSTVESTT